MKQPPTRVDPIDSRHTSILSRVLLCRPSDILFFFVIPATACVDPIDGSSFFFSCRSYQQIPVIPATDSYFPWASFQAQATSSLVSYLSSIQSTSLHRFHRHTADGLLSKLWSFSIDDILNVVRYRSRFHPVKSDLWRAAECFHPSLPSAHSRSCRSINIDRPLWSSWSPGAMVVVKLTEDNFY